MSGDGKRTFEAKGSTFDSKTCHPHAEGYILDMVVQSIAKSKYVVTHFAIYPLFQFLNESLGDTKSADEEGRSTIVFDIKSWSTSATAGMIMCMLIICE